MATVINPNSLPTYYPIHQTMLYWLLMDYLDPSLWVKGIVGFILALWWVSVAQTRSQAEYREPRTF